MLRYLVSEEWEKTIREQIDAQVAVLKSGWKPKIVQHHSIDCVQVDENYWVMDSFYIPVPPALHGYIWMPGSSMGYWLNIEEGLEKKLIHQEQYEWALEDAKKAMETE